MAEVEFAGVKFRGGRMVAVALGFSTLIGGLYGAFEVYKDYEDMKAQIQRYKAPDLSGFDKRLLVIETKINDEIVLFRDEMAALKERVNEMHEIVRDVRVDTRTEASELHTSMSDVDKRSRSLDQETRKALRQSEKTIRDMIASAQERFDTKISSIDTKLDALESRIRKVLQQALDNPLLKK